MKLIVICLIYSLTSSKADYWENRDALIKFEQSQVIGSNLTLTNAEEAVNEILMNLKYEELDEGFLNPERFLPAQHFFRSKPLIEKSKIFQFIQKLPKGCALHGHDLGLTSFEYVFNLTYRENLYACIVNNELKLHFFNSASIDDTCDWLQISEWRKRNATFDDLLKSKMTIVVPNPEEAYPDINVVWDKFAKIFPLIEPLITYKPIFQEFFYQTLQELYEDNVLCLEFRGYLPTVYDLDGRIYNQSEVIGLYEETLNQFKAHNVDFQGARLIYAPMRKVDNATMDDYIKNARSFKGIYPNFVAGFDLVGQEDLGNPLIDFISQLQEVRNEMNVFYHAGETNWYGEATDLNVIDAALLGTKRIGHGFALTKHPEVMNLIKSRGIGIEVNPISNQVLKLVADLRNHPATTLISQGFPVVISYDDPCMWGAKGLSYDWYMAFVGMTSRETDLKFLKQLALNSYLYNAMDGQEKLNAIDGWQQKWTQFITNILRETHIAVNLVN